MPTVVDDAGPNAAQLCLDCVEDQILEDFTGFDQFPEHHRVLLVKLGPGKFVAGSPTFDVYPLDLTEIGFRPLARGAAFPLDGRPFFCFSPMLDTDPRMCDMRIRAAALARLLGVDAPLPGQGPGAAKWHFSDTAYEKFADEIDAATMALPTTITRGAAALVLLQANDWTTGERVTPADLAAWKAEKREGAGRDPRLAQLAHAAGTKAPTFRDAMAGMTRTTVPPDTALYKGPSALNEVTDAVVATGQEPPGYHAAWVTSSGVNPKSMLCAEHFWLLTMLWMMATRDRLDLHASTGAEHCARRLLQIQRAVRRNPKSPDFSGLEAYTLHLSDPGGSLATPGFDEHVAKYQKNTAFYLKQTRLASEEQEAIDTNKNKNKNPNKNKNKNNNANNTEE